jgi:hypothetical protein
VRAEFARRVLGVAEPESLDITAACLQAISNIVFEGTWEVIVVDNDPLGVLCYSKLAD